MTYDIIKGSIFNLGEHRIICGNPTDIEYISTLMKEEFTGLVHINLNDMDMNRIHDRELYLKRLIHRANEFLIQNKIISISYTSDMFDFYHEYSKQFLDTFGEVDIRGHPCHHGFGLDDYEYYLIEDIKEFTAPNSPILDLSGGLNSVLEYCMESDRKAYIIRESRYDVLKIIERWEDVTGDKAEILDCEEEWNRYSFILQREDTPHGYDLMKHHRWFRGAELHKTIKVNQNTGWQPYF